MKDAFRCWAIAANEIESAAVEVENIKQAMKNNAKLSFDESMLHQFSSLADFEDAQLDEHRLIFTLTRTRART